MKIIISTKYFPKLIKKIIEEKYENFVIDANTSTIEFYSGPKYHRDNNIEVTIDSKDEVFRSKINPIQWFKIMEFVKQLPEQPIVVEFDYEEEPTIRLKQFVQTFC